MELAVKEFASLSSRAIAELCGVGHAFVQRIKPSQVDSESTSTVTGTDGKQYPATRSASRTATARGIDMGAIRFHSADVEAAHLGGRTTTGAAP